MGGKRRPRRSQVKENFEKVINVRTSELQVTLDTLLPSDFQTVSCAIEQSPETDPKAYRN